ncbi:MAG: ribosomal protein S18-alanine N-acetyltransferase [Anaerolineales bacterium]|nr:ribosomal protein S18-alanine N-acetyltransferase [Anaerolineales bacterium]
MTGLALKDAINISNRLWIRPMRGEDLAQVQAIDRQSFSLPWPNSAFHYELYENPNSIPWVAELLAAENAEDGPQDTSALQDSLKPANVVGMIVIWMILDEAHIATLAVHPEYRSQGIAGQLIARVLQEAIHKGAASATLEVRANNLTAQRLYQRFRFAEVGRRLRYYRDNSEDAIIMTVNGLGWEYSQWLESGAWQKSKQGEPDET